MPDTPTDDHRCASVHWSLPVQCVLPPTHAENWHEAWHPASGNRMRYRYPERQTEELHHDSWHVVELPMSAERFQAYRLGGAQRESIVDALANQLHRTESLHMHTLPGDEGTACRYCYLRAGRAVGALVPVAAFIPTTEQLEEARALASALLSALNNIVEIGTQITDQDENLDFDRLPDWLTQEPRGIPTWQREPDEDAEDESPGAGPWDDQAEDEGGLTATELWEADQDAEYAMDADDEERHATGDEA